MSAGWFGMVWRDVRWRLVQSATCWLCRLFSGLIAWRCLASRLGRLGNKGGGDERFGNIGNNVFGDRASHCWRGFACNLDQSQPPAMLSIDHLEVALKPCNPIRRPEHERRYRTAPAQVSVHRTPQVHDRGHCTIERNRLFGVLCKTKEFGPSGIGRDQRCLGRCDDERRPPCTDKPAVDLVAQLKTVSPGILSPFVHRQETSRINNLLDPYLRGVYEHYLRFRPGIRVERA